MKTSQSRTTRRKILRAGAGSLFVPMTLASGKAPAQGGKKPFEGVTLNISCWSSTYPTLLAQYIPEFTEKTGIKVNYDTPGFPVYNQRADLELSTKGSGFDVLNVTFIYTSRWIGAGWLTPLDEFIKNPERTPADWDFADFLPGAVQPMRDKNGAVYGIPWISDVMLAGAGRFDLFKANGLGMPDTFDELDRAMQIVNKKDSVAGYGVENHWGWTFIPFLQGFGGNVFRNPPDDLMPALDTPEAAEAAEFFAKLINSYGPPAAAGYTYDQVTEAHARRPHQLRAAEPRLPRPARRGREQGHGDVELLHGAEGAEGPLPRHRLARLGHPGRRQEQGRVVGVHQMGADQGDDRCAWSRSTGWAR